VVWGQLVGDPQASTAGDAPGELAEA
jgi:hypothetical protein